MAFIYSIYLLFLISTAAAVQEEVTIQTPLGKIRGLRKQIGDSKVDVFLGIPYALPPVGELRFRKPQPLERYRETVEAREAGPNCPSGRQQGSEDCLYLNLWVPVSDRQPYETPPLAVLAWVLGEWFVEDNTRNLDGARQAAHGKIIVATIGYRLGALGFLAVGREANAGLYDQNLALRWLRHNLGYFGGDPSAITLVGHGAGAVSAGLHLVSPLAKGLFHRAILQSGSPHAPFTRSEKKQGLLMAHYLSERLDCVSPNVTVWLTPESILACLRTKSSSDLLEAETELYSHLMEANKEMRYFLPVLGDNLVPLSSSTPFVPSYFNDVDVLTGITKDEGSTLLSDLIDDSIPMPILQELEEIVKTFFFKNTNYDASSLVNDYTQGILETDSTSIKKALSDFFGDWIYRCPAVYFADSFASRLNKVHFYMFTYGQDVQQEWMGAAHGAELPFFFDLADNTTSKELSEKENIFSQQMIDLWTSFAKFGHPSTGRHYYWPRYLPPGRAHLLELHPALVTFGDVPRAADRCQRGWKEAYFDPHLLATLRTRQKTLQTRIKMDGKLPFGANCPS